MPRDSRTQRIPVGGDVVELRPRPSATRSASSRRVRLVQEAKRGNQNSMRSGIHSEIQNLPHVADEIATVYAVHPHLDRLADFRLVELLAVATISHRRAVLAIERDGLDANLAKYESNLGARVERHLERVYARNAERARSAAADAAKPDLAKYRPTPREVTA